MKVTEVMLYLHSVLSPRPCMKQNGGNDFRAEPVHDLKLFPI